MPVFFPLQEVSVRHRKEEVFPGQPRFSGYERSLPNNKRGSVSCNPMMIFTAN